MIFIDDSDFPKRSMVGSDSPSPLTESMLDSKAGCPNYATGPASAGEPVSSAGPAGTESGPHGHDSCEPHASTEAGRQFNEQLLVKEQLHAIQMGLLALSDRLDGKLPNDAAEILQKVTAEVQNLFESEHLA